VSALFLALAPAACAAAGRDVAGESRDQRGPVPDARASVPTPRGDGYAYVARRLHSAVGLVGTHYVKDDDAQRMVDRMSDELESCARRLEGSGALVEGAASLVAVAGARGTTEISDIRFAPGGAVAANALECIVAPLRARPFPPTTDGGIAAVAIEATWAPNGRGKPDAGGRM